MGGDHRNPQSMVTTKIARNEWETWKAPIAAMEAMPSATITPRGPPRRWATQPTERVAITVTIWRDMNSVPISVSLMPRSRSQTGQ